MTQKVTGLCKVNNEGIQRLETCFSNPAIKRHAENVRVEEVSYIQYGNALNLHETYNIPLEEIIEKVPNKEQPITLVRLKEVKQATQGLIDTLEIIKENSDTANPETVILHLKELILNEVNEAIEELKK